MTGINFTAIDFETASESNTSACALGIVRIKDGLIAESKKWLIKPYPFLMNPNNQAIHGISIADLETAPTFEEIFPEVAPLISGQVIVAHNCAFDIDKLNALMQHYGHFVNIGPTVCTMSLVKSLFPDASSKLEDITEIFGIELKHHDPLSDAAASAQLFIKLIKLTNAGDVTDIFSKKKAAKKAPVPVNKDFYRHKLGSSSDVVVSFDLSVLTNPAEWSWTGKRVVVSGIFKKYEREELTEKLKGLGAIISSGISGATNVLLLGHEGVGPSKLEKAKKLNIHLMGEDDFDKLC